MKDALPWIAMLMVSFVAPYAYLLASAGQLPSYVVGGIVAWMVVFGALAAVRMSREVKASKEPTDASRSGQAPGTEHAKSTETA